MKEDIENTVGELTKKAMKAEDGVEAQHYTQAVLNLMNALSKLTDVEYLMNKYKID